MEATIRTNNWEVFNSVIQLLKYLNFEIENKNEIRTVANKTNQTDFNQLIQSSRGFLKNTIVTSNRFQQFKQSEKKLEL